MDQCKWLFLTQGTSVATGIAAGALWQCCIEALYGTSMASCTSASNYLSDGDTGVASCTSTSVCLPHRAQVWLRGPVHLAISFRLGTSVVSRTSTSSYLLHRAPGLLVERRA